MNPRILGEHFGHHVVWTLEGMVCPACLHAIIELSGNQFDGGQADVFSSVVYPRSSVRPPASVEVPTNLADDYNEACAVLPVSAKASAALSRRCLQLLLREQGFAHHNLVDAINAAVATGKLPSAISQNLDTVRQIGNFAAHPMKDKNTGEVLPVEPEEAEWNLVVLAGLFDFYYVEPERAKKARAALNEKLIAAGKKPLSGVA